MPIFSRTNFIHRASGIVALCKRLHNTPVESRMLCRNVVQKEAEKKLKYKSLCIELQRMWNLKCMIIPIIIGATGIVTRSLRKNLEAVPGKHSIDSLQ